MNVPSSGKGGLTVEINYNPTKIDATSCKIEPDNNFDSRFYIPEHDESDYINDTGRQPGLL